MCIINYIIYDTVVFHMSLSRSVGIYGNRNEKFVDPNKLFR
jgi:hypothetical protein